MKLYRRSAVLINLQAMAGQSVIACTFGKYIAHIQQSVWQVIIIAVEPAEDVSRGALETFVDRMALPPVWLAHPVSQPGFVLTNNFTASVRAVPVNDDVFEVRIILKQNRADGLFDEPCLVVRGSNDADFRRIENARMIERTANVSLPRPSLMSGGRRREFADCCGES